MPTAQYSALAPTGDLVFLNSSEPYEVVYPASDVVDTFGTLWTPRVFAQQLGALELGSAGKVAFTLSNEHSLDMRLNKPAKTVELEARNGNALLISTQSTGQSLSLDSGSNQSLTAAAAMYMSGSNSLDLASGRNLVTLVGGAGGDMVLQSGGGDAVVSVSDQHSIDFYVNSNLVGSFQHDATDGRYALSVPTLKTASGFDSDRLDKKVVYLAGRSSDRVADGGSNDVSGIVVVGAPDGIQTHLDRFQKSILWHSPTPDAMRYLATERGVAEEPFWEVRGGSMRLTHTNPSSGSEMSYALRINQRDELEIVRRKLDAWGEETVEEVARFGQKRQPNGSVGSSTADVGTLSFQSAERVAQGAGLDVVVRSFHCFNAYEVILGLYNQFDTPDSDEMVREFDGGNPNMAGLRNIAPNSDVVRSGLLPDLFIAPPAHGLLDNVPYLAAAVIRDTVTGAYSKNPVTAIAYHLASGSLVVPKAGGGGVETPVNIQLVIGRDSTAAAAIVNTTRTLYDWFVANNPAYQPSEVSSAFMLYVTTHYAAFITYAYTLDTDTWGVPEPGPSVAPPVSLSSANLDEVKFFRHFTVLHNPTLSQVMLVLPLDFSVNPDYAPGAGEGALVDQYNRPCGYLRVDTVADTVAPVTSGLAGFTSGAGWTLYSATKVSVGADASQLVRNAAHVALEADWGRLVTHVTRSSVWKVPLDWKALPASVLGLSAW